VNSVAGLCDPGKDASGSNPMRFRLSQQWSGNEEAPQTLILAGLLLARTTGLEPATTGSTVRYSNQLSYVPRLMHSAIEAASVAKRF
jgi:hypothetical protein